MRHDFHEKHELIKQSVKAYISIYNNYVFTFFLCHPNFNFPHTITKTKPFNNWTTRERNIQQLSFANFLACS